MEILETKAYALKGYDVADRFRMKKLFHGRKGQYYVYSWFRRGVCLYVGVSGNIASRFYHHSTIGQSEPVLTDDTFFFEPKENETVAKSYEKQLIFALKPQFNGSGKTVRQTPTAVANRRRDIDRMLQKGQKKLNELRELAKTLYPDSVVSTQRV